MFLRFIFVGLVGMSIVGGERILLAQDFDKKVQEIQLNVASPVSVALITISDDTSIKYEESSRIKDKKLQEVDYVSQKDYDGLVKLILGSDFFSMEDDYHDPSLSDAPSYTVSVKADDRVKSVRCFGACPDPAIRIMDRIRELWGKEILVLGVE